MELEKLTLEKIWNSYARAYFHITPDMQKELLEKSAKPLFGNILDAGCGVGKIIEYLKYYDSYFGIDSNTHMLDVAIYHNSSKKKNIEFSLQDVSSFSKKNFYDSVCSINVLYALDDPLKMIKRVYENLKFGGVFVLASPNHSLDMQVLEEIIIEEFNSKNRNDDNSSNFLNQFIESNRQLAGVQSSKGFKPKLFDDVQITSLLSKEGFEILNKDSSYHNQLFHIICQKI